MNVLRIITVGSKAQERSTAMADIVKQLHITVDATAEKLAEITGTSMSARSARFSANNSTLPNSEQPLLPKVLAPELSVWVHQFGDVHTFGVAVKECTISNSIPMPRRDIIVGYPVTVNLRQLG